MNLVKIKVGGVVATVNDSIAPKLQRADEAMYRITGDHIKINQSYRSTGQQTVLYINRKPGQRVAEPGKSFHEKGLAIDVTNWLEAQPFLHKEGFKNDLADDRGHFSIGEFGARAAIRKGFGFFGFILFVGIVYLLTRK